MNKKLYIIILISQFLCGNMGYCEIVHPKTLYSYTGYLTIPSAYVDDGNLGFHYSYIPSSVAINTSNNKSDNWIFSGAIGFFPFLECYLSVYIEPQNNISNNIPNFGANKFRSGGAKFVLHNESKRLPAIAIGIFDPDIKKIGSKQSANNVSSTFVVFSKQNLYKIFSFSFGYGSDIFLGKFSRLNGVFGGFNIFFKKNISFMIDYDAKYWSQGINIQWKHIDVECVLINQDDFALRIGYNFDLLQRKF